MCAGKVTINLSGRDLTISLFRKGSTDSTGGFPSSESGLIKNLPLHRSVEEPQTPLEKSIRYELVAII